MKKILGLFIAVVFAFSIAGCDKSSSSKGNFKFSKEFLDANLEETVSYDSFTSAAEIFVDADFDIVSYNVSDAGLIMVTKDGKFGYYNILLSRMVVDIQFETVTMNSIYSDSSLMGYISATKQNAALQTEVSLYSYDGVCLLASDKYDSWSVYSETYDYKSDYIMVEYSKDGNAYTYGYLYDKEAGTVSSQPIDFSLAIGATYSDLESRLNYVDGMSLCYNKDYLFQYNRLNNYDEYKITNIETGKEKTYKLDRQYLNLFYPIFSINGFIVAQRRIALPDYATSYDIYSSTGKYNVETIKIDYIKGTVKEIDFDYYVLNSETYKDVDGNYNYAALSAYKISDKNMESARLYTLMVDKNLKITDITEELFGDIEKVADDRYISYFNGRLYYVNGKLELICRLDDTASNYLEVYPESEIVVDTYSGYVINSELKLIYDSSYSYEIQKLVNGKLIATKPNAAGDDVDTFVLNYDGTATKLDLENLQKEGAYFYSSTSGSVTKFFAGSTELFNVTNEYYTSFVNIKDSGNMLAISTTSTDTRYFIIS